MATAKGFDDTTVSDELALNFHLMHPGEDSAPGDPNLAYCLDGVYHLHYIVRHPWRGGTARLRDGKTSFCFIHVTSPDMLHWEWQTTKLQPSFTGHGTFSGTGFITKDGKPAAMYPGLSDPGRTYITVAEDNQLSRWTKPYPVLPTGVPEGKKVILAGDPDLFQAGDTYYAYSAGDNLELVKSTDLVNWRYVGPLLQRELPDVALGEDTSCANLFPLGDRWMLLCISHQIGCRYYLGDWDAEAEQFVPQLHGRMNWRRAEQSLTEPGYRDFFAPESVLTPDGRRVMWAWLCTADPAIDLKSVQSLPRELSLHADGTLRIEPLRELKTLRYDPVTLHDVVVPPLGGRPAAGQPSYARTSIAEPEGDAFEVRVTVDRAEAERHRFGVLLFADDDHEGLPVLIRPETGTICAGATEAPFAVADLPAGEDLELRIFVDKYLVEVFVNGRQALLTVFTAYRDGGSELRAYLFGSRGRTPPLTLRTVEIWKLRPTNQGFFDARATAGSGSPTPSSPGSSRSSPRGCQPPTVRLKSVCPAHKPSWTARSTETRAGHTSSGKEEPIINQLKIHDTSYGTSEHGDGTRWASKDQREQRRSPLDTAPNNPGGACVRHFPISSSHRISWSRKKIPSPDP